MENFIYTYFRKRKLRQLLVKIMRAHPEMAPALVDLSEEDALTKYLYTAINEYMVQKLTYEQACETQPERASFIRQPDMPWLLTQAAMAWANQEAYMYAILLVQKDLELIVLRRQTKEEDEMKSIRAEQSRITGQLADITNRVEQELQKAVQGINPENRLN
jgi:hypothetical protein